MMSSFLAIIVRQRRLERLKVSLDWHGQVGLQQQRLQTLDPSARQWDMRHHENHSPTRRATETRLRRVVFAAEVQGWVTLHFLAREERALSRRNANPSAKRFTTSEGIRRPQPDYITQPCQTCRFSLRNSGCRILLQSFCPSRMSTKGGKSRPKKARKADAVDGGGGDEDVKGGDNALMLAELQRRDPRVQDILGAAKQVLTDLGHGLHESVYQKALALLLSLKHYACDQEVSLPYMYQERCVGFGRLDLLVDKSIIIETKALAAQPQTTARHVRQLHHYLVQYSQQHPSLASSASSSSAVVGLLIQFPIKADLPLAISIVHGNGPLSAVEGVEGKGEARPPPPTLTALWTCINVSIFAPVLPMHRFSRMAKSPLIL